MTEAAPIELDATPSSTIPPDVIDKLKVFNDAVTALEDALKPHFEVGFEQHLERSALEMARTDIMSLFTINSLAWSLASMKGEDPKENLQIGEELKRTKAYVGRLRAIEDRKAAPRMNPTVAKNFVRNALWEVPKPADKVQQFDEAGNAIPKEEDGEEGESEDGETQTKKARTEKPSYSQKRVKDESSGASTNKKKKRTPKK